MTTQTDTRWLLLIHQIPPKPDYLRVKIGRRLQKIGAVAIKNSVYVLPANERALEDFNWIVKEVVEDGGDASILDARFVEGLADEQVRELFQNAREAEYAEVTRELATLSAQLPRKGAPKDAERAGVAAQLDRLKKRFDETVARDFFGAPSRERLTDAVAALEARLHEGREPAAARSPSRPLPLDRYRGWTWVTRKGIHVDRMASAWLIRRFIDPKARFRFVAPKSHTHREGELRFDMFAGEFTHEGEQCTFEVLLHRFGLTDSALKPLAEIIHDIDLKDSKFGREDVGGFEHLVAGIAMAHEEDDVRLERASAVLDDLYEYFRRKRA